MIFAVDFDGTIALTDTVDALLGKFADPAWQTIEEDWIAGRIGSRDCMKDQLRLVSANRATLEAFFDDIKIDPSFVDFVRAVAGFATVVVVGDGIDYPIRQMLHKLGLHRLPVYSNKLIFTSNGLELTFPYWSDACAVGSGVCKCRVARSLDREYLVLIGDGRSDFCLARSADYVFAKGPLVGFCEREQIPCTPFSSFADILTVWRRGRRKGGVIDKVKHHVS